MGGLRLAILLGTGTVSASAHAFFDDFLGDHLNDNWGWAGLASDYFVADSNLVVTNVTFHSGEDSYSNLQSATGYGDDYDQVDFSARIKISFTPGSQVFVFSLGNFYNGYSTGPQFQLWGYPDVRYLTFETNGGAELSDTLALPPSGTHILGVDRINRQYTALLDGQPFFTSSRSFGYQTGQHAVTLSYAGSFENAPFMVDYVSVEVVPEPSAILSLSGLLPLLGARRLFLKR